ncbi:MAG TPA: HDOD domain-containing protein [Pirellulaceae bacterium]|nr:HDOD domain-containing protein [Pirellulaceae bacterium]
MTEAGETQTVGLIQQFVERTGQLYSLPAAAAEILRLTSEPTIDPRALKECLESDPALAARILRVVNSSLFGPTRQVTDLNQALTLLGIRPLKMLVLGFSLPKELFAGLEAEVLARYWRQTLVKAVAARELSERLWHVPGDEPFLAGLVQDIGVLALIQQLGLSYQRLLSHVQSRGGSLLARELDTLGFDHLVLSARLLGHWGLPPGLCAAISIPPDEDRIDDLTKDERTLPRMLHLADLLARLIDQPYGGALGELLAVGSRYCNLTYEKLQPIVAAIQHKVEELADVLSLQLPEGQSYVDLLLAAQERLAHETVSVAAAMAQPDTEGELLAVAGDLRSELAAVSRRGPTAGGHGRFAPPLTTHHSPSRLAGHGSIRDRTASTATAIDPGLASRVSAAVQQSRQTRTPFTLALFEIDHFGDVILELGPAGMTEVAYSLQSALADWTSQPTEALLVSDSQLAMLWDDCPRSDAVQRARDCLAAVHPWSREQFPLGADLTLSIGLATLESAPKNYPSHELINAAHRCLSGAQLSGGDSVKSIAF